MIYNRMRHDVTIKIIVILLCTPGLSRNRNFGCVDGNTDLPAAVDQALILFDLIWVLQQ